MLICLLWPTKGYGLIFCDSAPWLDPCSPTVYFTLKKISHQEFRFFPLEDQKKQGSQAESFEIVRGVHRKSLKRVWMCSPSKKNTKQVPHTTPREIIQQTVLVGTKFDTWNWILCLDEKTRVIQFGVAREGKKRETCKTWTQTCFYSRPLNNLRHKCFITKENKERLGILLNHFFVNKPSAI